MEKLSRNKFINFNVNLAIQEAIKSTCLRRKCGAIVVNGSGYILGRGFNSPPGNLESQRRCINDKLKYNNKITDKTCCVHAEQRAILQAVSNIYFRLDGELFLYFMSVDNNGEPIPSGKPYCTLCSKLALDNGITHWVLQHEAGLFIYDSGEYNDLSYSYKG